MATPTIVSITPNNGLTAGSTFIKITGTNFRLPDPQLAYGHTTSRKPTVDVQIGTEYATDVQVVSTSILYLRTPVFQGPPVDGHLPALNVLLRNLDNNGVPVLDEGVLALNAFTYRRPPIHGSPIVDSATSPYTLVSHALIGLLKRQVIQNTVLTTHVDFAEPGVLSINVAATPALVIQGPTVTRDLEYCHNEQTTIDNGDGTISLHKPPFVARFAYTIIGISDNEREITNMVGSFQTCFDVIKHLPVDLDPVDLSKGRVYPVLQLTAPPQTTSAPSDSNIRTFIATCEVRGIEVTETDAAGREYYNDESDLQVQQIDGVTVETIKVF